jgi:hypothetical protein
MSHPRAIATSALALAWLLLLAAGSASADPPKRNESFRKNPKQTWTKRGVYFFAGPYKSPLAGLGARGDYACNRIALDNDSTRATWDPHARKIVIRNTREYEDETLIADVMLTGHGTTIRGERVPLGVHLRVFKEDDEFAPVVHAHVVVEEEVRQADFLSLQVVLDDGKRRTVALTKSLGLRAVKNPFAESALAKVIGLKAVNNLKGKRVLIGRPGARLADGSIGLGRGFLSKMVLRAQLVSLEGSKRIPPTGNLAQVLATGAYELRLTALSSVLPQDKVARDLFLLGLDRLPMLRDTVKNGLKDGETLVFSFSHGKGTIRLGRKSAVVANAAEIVRRYLEFDFLGAIVRHQMLLRLSPRPKRRGK